MYAVALALEEGHEYKARDLALRLKWTVSEADSFSVDAILRGNNLAPAHVCKIQDMPLHKWAVVGHDVAIRTMSTTWKLYSNGKWYEKVSLEAFAPTNAHVLSNIAQWTGWTLHSTLDDALAARKPNEYVFATDWAKPGEVEDSKVKRFLCCTRAKIPQMAKILLNRPKCDRSLYTVMLTWYAVRILQLDIEALISLNPHLQSKDAQRKYGQTLLELLREYLGNVEISRMTSGYASDATKFSNRTIVELAQPLVHGYLEHDDLILGFIQWLKSKPEAQSLIVTLEYADKKEKDATGKAKRFEATGFALDPLATGAFRQMRVLKFTKCGHREIEPDDRLLSVVEAINRSLPIDLDRPSSPFPAARPLRNVFVNKLPSGQPYLLKSNQKEKKKKIASLQSTCLFNYNKLYHFLKRYHVDKDQKDQTTIMWMQTDRVSRFAVPLAEMRKLNELLAKTHTPTFLHEVCDQTPDRWRRFHVDLDGTKLAPEKAALCLEQFLRKYTNATNLTVVVKLAPPKVPGSIWYHLIVIGAVMQGFEPTKALRILFDQYMAAEYGRQVWPESCVDVNPKNLRKLGADKDNFKGRTLAWGGAYRGGQLIHISDPVQQHEMSSIFPAAAGEELLILPSEERMTKQKKNSNSKGDPFDPTNDQHQCIAQQVNALLQQHDVAVPVDIETIEDESDHAVDPHWIAHLDSGFCITLKKQIDRGSKSVDGRASAYEHDSNKGSIKFRPTRMMPYCTDTDCSVIRKRERFPTFPLSAEARQILFALDIPHNHDEPLPDGGGNERSLVLSVFPEDTALWPSHAETWRLGVYFGPCSTYTVDYVIGLGSIVRRQKEGAKRPVSCEVRPLPLMAQTPGYEYDADKARAMLEACGEGCIRIDLDTIFFYDQTSGTPTHSIRYNVDPPRYNNGKQVSKPMADACKAFYRTVRLLPIDRMAIAMDHKKRWLKVLASPDHFILDEGACDEPVNYDLLPESAKQGMCCVVAPCGASKTSGLQESGFKGHICTHSIAVAKNLASRFGIQSYRDPETDHVRKDLATSEEPFCFVINSILKAEKAPIKELVNDEITAKLHTIPGKTNKGKGPAVLTAFSNLNRKVKRVTSMSADATAELEGHYFVNMLGRRDLHVLYKVHGPSAAATDCRELMSDNEFWDVLVRILKHNAQAASFDDCIKVYIPCSAAAAVKRVKHLCKRYWPAGLDRCIWLHSNIKAPKDFLEKPNDTWPNYAIVCCSTTLKVGVSMEKKHFHVTLAFVQTGCGTTEDINQLLQRARAVATLTLIRILLGGGAGKKGQVDPEETEAELAKYGTEHRIDRSILPPQPAFVKDPHFEWLAQKVDQHKRLDHKHFLHNVRRDLRKRQMTVQLGGVPHDQPLAFGPFVLPPLPKGTNLSGPNATQEHIDRILDAPDIDKKQLHALYANHKRTPEEDAQIDRYKIRKELFREDGPLDFDELVVEYVKNHFDEKVELAGIALRPDEHAAARVDEAQRMYKEPEDRQHHLKKRKVVREFLGTVGMDPAVFLGGGAPPFKLTRKRLLEEDPLPRMEELIRNDALGVLPKRSTSDDPIKKCIGYINSMAERMGQPTLRPSKRKWGTKMKKGKKKRSKITTEWTLQNQQPALALFYAGIHSPPKLLDAPVVVEHKTVDNPIIYEDRVVDPHSGHPYPLAPLPRDMMVVHIELPNDDAEDGFDFAGTLEHAVCSMAKVPLGQVTCSMALFHRHRLLRVLFSPPLEAALIHAATKRLHMKLHDKPHSPPSHIPPPHLPTWCLERRVRLLRRGTHWTMEDASTYLAPARDASATPTEYSFPN